MTESDLDALISSTLNAIDGDEKLTKHPEVQQPVEEGSDIDECLKKLDNVAPKVAKPADETDESLGKLLDDLLTPETILDSMEALSTEMDKFLATDPSLSAEELQKHSRQSEIYKEVAKIYKESPNISEDESHPESGRLRDLLAELQELGQPPKQVIESLMISQLSGDGMDGGSLDFMKEFQQFVGQATSGDGSASLPGLTEEDEQILKQLTTDPNAMKNLLSGMGNKDGDCCIS